MKGVNLSPLQGWGLMGVALTQAVGRASLFRPFGAQRPLRTWLGSASSAPHFIVYGGLCTDD